MADLDDRLQEVSADVMRIREGQQRKAAAAKQQREDEIRLGDLAAIEWEKLRKEIQERSKGREVEGKKFFPQDDTIVYLANTYLNVKVRIERNGFKTFYVTVDTIGGAHQMEIILEASLVDSEVRWKAASLGRNSSSTSSEMADDLIVRLAVFYKDLVAATT